MPNLGWRAVGSYIQTMTCGVIALLDEWVNPSESQKRTRDAESEVQQKRVIGSHWQLLSVICVLSLGVLAVKVFGDAWAHADNAGAITGAVTWFVVVPVILFGLGFVKSGLQTIRQWHHRVYTKGLYARAQRRH